MHTLVGCYIEEASEGMFYDGETFQKLIIRLSSKIKRVFFFKTEALRAQWVANIKEVVDVLSPSIKNGYSIGSVLLG